MTSISNPKRNLLISTEILAHLSAKQQLKVTKSVT
jgi:hypothetical protein